ncbi:MAG: hypothetical protein HQ508_07000 [Candidatus Marinimicrobia bacterium]|nr:hypothetical protein [Candidatus Neomarinimicrobiota bacterium]
MDFDNIGPIVLFIAYMAISAWAKQRKARQRATAKLPKDSVSAESNPHPVRRMSGILDQLKKELFEEAEPFTLFQGPAETELKAGPELKMEAEAISSEPVAVPNEGSDKSPGMKLKSKATDVGIPVAEGQLLDEMLEPFSSIQKGILLHELLGKPRAYQDNDEWFHKS